MPPDDIEEDALVYNPSGDSEKVDLATVALSEMQARRARQNVEAARRRPGPMSFGTGSTPSAEATLNQAVEFLRRESPEALVAAGFRILSEFVRTVTVQDAGMMVGGDGLTVELQLMLPPWVKAGINGLSTIGSRHSRPVSQAEAAMERYGNMEQLARQRDLQAGSIARGAATRTYGPRDLDIQVHTNEPEKTPAKEAQAGPKRRRRKIIGPAE